MIVYGTNSVHEALRGPRSVSQIWATKRVAQRDWLDRHRPLVSLATSEEVEALCHSAEHQGICAQVAPYRYVPATQLLSVTQPVIVALDQIQDPQNFGAICRTAECARVTGVVIPKRRSAEVTPAVCRASAGAVEHLAIAQVENLANFLAEAKESGCWCYGTAAGASARYDTVDYREEGVVVVFGSEGSGLRPRVAQSCDQLISLPLCGKIESLNVSASAAIVIYEILRQKT
jgi:23S rRNA (guanosine2251-2'-O)-methyltransferase